MTKRLPFLMMRGGTSRGVYVNRADLPAEREALSAVLLSLIGAEHPLCVDGLGGGTAVTCKVAMISPSEVAGCDVDYLFAQVSPEKALVDFNPTCGNMLVGVGPAAIEMGLIPAADPLTRVEIHAVNTGARIGAEVQTPGSRVRYDGAATIDGIPGSAAPIGLQFHGIEGSVTGKMMPTGRVLDRIGGIDVTCLDIAMPVVIARAADFGLSGQE
ncbi:MAG: PrpF domain-containing protein, partial [Pseudomonadota bacterium]